MKNKFSNSIGKDRYGSIQNASYKGVSYEIKTKGSAPHTLYKAITFDLELQSDWQDSATRAGDQLRKYIDESIVDRDR